MFKQVRLITVSEQEIANFCQRKFGITPNQRVLARLAEAINNQECTLTIMGDFTGRKLYQEVLDYFSDQYQPKIKGAM